jgi:hypothetical protein
MIMVFLLVFDAGEVPCTFCFRVVRISKRLALLKSGDGNAFQAPIMERLFKIVKKVCEKVILTEAGSGISLEIRPEVGSLHREVLTSGRTSAPKIAIAILGRVFPWNNSADFVPFRPGLCFFLTFVSNYVLLQPDGRDYFFCSWLGI